MFRRISFEEASKLFFYDPKTGIVVWNENRACIRKGERAGGLAGSGQRFVRVRGECIMISHLALALTRGSWPTGQILHLNGDLDDDRFENLFEMGGQVPEEDLKKIISYNPESGEFRWKTNYGKKIKAGAVAGGLDKNNGYWHIRIGYNLIRAHRLAFFYMTGQWPKDSVDHIDGDRANNKWSNLREISNIYNVQNAGIRTDNSSGRKGVSHNVQKGLWEAYLNFDGVRYHKWARTFEDACIIREKMENVLHEFRCEDNERVSFKLKKLEDMYGIRELTLEDI